MKQAYVEIYSALCKDVRILEYGNHGLVRISYKIKHKRATYTCWVEYEAVKDYVTAHPFPTVDTQRTV